ncbi:MAG TPA: tryptophan 2,3-dioxygenase family protein, partial [Thermoanaerobaculia bacterium]
MPDAPSSKPLTYASYLKIDELLALQEPRSGGPGEPAEHDETLFIVIHQVYELWFKQVLHELAHLQRSLEVSDAATALDTFKRTLTILKILVAQVDILET